MYSNIILQVISAAEVNGVKLKGVLTTHHHWDHAGGNKEISSKLGLEVIGGICPNRLY